jgi:uncharacterized protein (TIGR02757 family)
MDEPLRRALLDERRRAPRLEYLRNDPVQLPHRYRRREDREIVALIAALLAFGRVKAFLPKIEQLLALSGRSPRAYVDRFAPDRDRGFFAAFRHRVYRGEDLRRFFLSLRRVLDAYGTLESAFIDAAPEGGAHRERLISFAGLFRRADAASGVDCASRGGVQVGGGPCGAGASDGELTEGYRHLVADPRGGGACKRWNLFLRWVVRPEDGVDLGLWRRVDPADLILPLDVHVGRISRLLGIRKRRTLDWKAAEEVTEHLRAADPRDPLRFDFALSHIGITDGCRGRWWGGICGSCRLRRLCAAGRRRS